MGVPLGVGRGRELVFSPLRGGKEGLQLGSGLEVGGLVRPFPRGTRQARGVGGCPRGGGKWSGIKMCMGHSVLSFALLENGVPNNPLFSLLHQKIDRLIL